MLSARYGISRRLMDEHTELVEARPLTSHVDGVDDFESVLLRHLNDYKLRQIIADETRDIKTILYAKAFAEDEDLSEKDIHD